MKSSLSDRQRIDAFCRDLALVLRRITGREVDVDTQQIPTVDAKQRVAALFHQTDSTGETTDD